MERRRRISHPHFSQLQALKLHLPSCVNSRVHDCPSVFTYTWKHIRFYNPL